MTTVGIREVSDTIGVSVDTLRWYEKEGLLPRVPRGADGRRRYDEQALGFLQLIRVLRRTGMPVADVRAFVRMADEGAASHGRRMALLTGQRGAIQERMAELRADLRAVENKIDHYQELIDRGLDCDGEAVEDETATRQRELC
jgi:DNA-binding transcriptional MerR regulator